MVKSRLPALVRAATSTAIGRPTQRTGPVGRPGRAALAGAAVAGALLVSVPFLVLGDRDHKDGKGPETAGTVLGGSGQEAPGDFALSPPGDGPSGSAEPEEPVREDSAPASAGNGSGKADTGSEPGKGESTSTPPGAAEQDGSAGTKAQPARQSAGKSSDATADKPPASRPALTLSAPVSLRSHLSGRCIDVPGADFGDGKKLYVWDCNNSTAQRWQFASDGTVRIAGLCLDVAGANFGDGTPIQIARCNGNAAQQFTLNPSHDLVNTVVGKCVDIRNNNPGNGAWLQLWSCAGSANQKWSA
ncbi:ricin-type beta-trefoil lectin domain protein [Streptomyces pacificus]|uniref:ricin-type beta-trefoil lectin domain protein n=1 Tax=Streptomyces pacificus TaxID=2705029 RepID=UPI0020B14343|nr:ricin-type beta-trefoil lectin domain protein [Streptomyces pacificus]